MKFIFRRNDYQQSWTFFKKNWFRIGSVLTPGLEEENENFPNCSHFNNVTRLISTQPTPMIQTMQRVSRSLVKTRTLSKYLIRSVEKKTNKQIPNPSNHWQLPPARLIVFDWQMTVTGWQKTFREITVSNYHHVGNASESPLSKNQQTEKTENVKLIYQIIRTGGVGIASVGPQVVPVPKKKVTWNDKHDLAAATRWSLANAKLMVFATPPEHGGHRWDQGWTSGLKKGG